MGVGRWLAVHRRTVIAVWLVIVIALAIGARAADTEPQTSFTVPGSQSNAAFSLLEETFPEITDAQVTVVYKATSGTIDDDANDAIIDETVAALQRIALVSKVTSPTQLPERLLDVSKDEPIAYSTVVFSEKLSDLPNGTFDEVVAAITPARDAGLEVDVDGLLVDAQNPPRGALSQYAGVISIVVAILIITLAFGAPIVSLMPIGVALVALITGHSLLSILELWFSISSVNEVLGTMLALGVGIDYSLLIINRHRQLRADGNTVLDSIGGAWSTTGTSVLLAAVTVCIATLALALVGVPLVTMLGLTTAMFVAITAIAALTLLPALLGAAGENLDRWSLPWAGGHSKFWPRWASVNARLRWPLAIVPLLVLAIAFFPVPSAELGIIDDGSMPESTTQRRAYDNLDAGFGPGANGPLIVVAEIPADADDADILHACEAMTSAIRNVDGVSSVSPAKVSNDAEGTLCGLPPGLSASTSESASGSTAASGGAVDSATGGSDASGSDQSGSGVEAFVFRVTPTTGPDAPATTDLVNQLRQDVIPPAAEGTVLDANAIYVGGQTAIFIDFTNRIKDRLPLYIGAVLLLAFALLMTAFRSLVIPVTAVLMALVSFLAAYGITIAVFQWGWLRDVVGLADTVPIETFFPLMLFAILFGLSMDYEVFLVGRIHEEAVSGRDANESVTVGLGATGKIILSAGLIMTSVFLAFATNPSPVVKQLAFGLAVAVAIDALIIRLIVMPALLHIFGKSTWWLPRWLDRILPHVRIG